MQTCVLCACPCPSPSLWHPMMMETSPWLINAAFCAPFSACFTPLALYISGVTCPQHPLPTPRCPLSSFLANSQRCSHCRCDCWVQASPYISSSPIEDEPSPVQARMVWSRGHVGCYRELATAACLGVVCAQIKRWRALR